MGKRMRPHTLTTPKPLIKVAGKPIVELLCEELAKVCTEPIDEIAFIIGPTFGTEAEENLKAIATRLGAKGSVYYQHEALGTAHAVYMAEQSIAGKVIVAFADTLFKANFEMTGNEDAVIWVKQIDDPRQFGVVKIDGDGTISDFVEKPVEFVSDLAIIGIYYFNDGDALKAEIKYLLDNNLKEKGEFQITNALQALRNKGAKIYPGKVDEWLDCGNKDITVQTNARWLALHKDSYTVPATAKLENAEVVQPCFIAEGVEIRNSTVGPYVSVGANSVINGSTVTNAIIQNNAVVQNATITNSMLGAHTHVSNANVELSISDYSIIKGN